MKAFLLKILPIFLPILLCCCSGSREFRLDADSDDIGTQNVTIVYYADGAYHSETASAIDGKFSITGMLANPTFAEVFTATGQPLGEFIVDGGDHIEARFSIANPDDITIKGNKDSEMFVEFLKENRQLIQGKNTDQLNRSIEAFIRENPKRFLSLVLLTRYFTVEGSENLALELFQQIPEKYRRPDFTAYFEQLLSRSLESDTMNISAIRAFSLGDSALTFSPSRGRLNLMMLTDNECRSTDSIKSMLTAVRAGAPAPEQLRITDFSCDRDTMLWHSSLRLIDKIADYPANIDRLWLVAGMATDGVAQTAPTSLPYFILADSTGRMLYHGSSVAAARAAFGRYRKLL